MCWWVGLQNSKQQHCSFQDNSRFPHVQTSVKCKNSTHPSSPSSYILSDVVFHLLTFFPFLTWTLRSRNLKLPTDNCYHIDLIWFVWGLSRQHQHEKVEQTKFLYFCSFLSSTSNGMKLPFQHFSILSWGVKVRISAKVALCLVLIIRRQTTQKTFATFIYVFISSFVDSSCSSFVSWFDFSMPFSVVPVQDLSFPEKENFLFCWFCVNEINN